MKPLKYQQYPAPFGDLFIYADEHSIKAVVFKPWTHKLALNAVNEETSIIKTCYKQLSEYFSGKRKIFDLTIDADGTEFQQKVWQQLCEIPYGISWSYGQLASNLGNKNASRAVGAANGKNPISIIVPCHRVIGANGSLTGYAGGLRAKKWLLEHEGIL